MQKTGIFRVLFFKYVTESLYRYPFSICVFLPERLQMERKMQLRGGIYHRLQIDMTYNSSHMEGSRLTHEQTRYIFEAILDYFGIEYG